MRTKQPRTVVFTFIPRFAPKVERGEKLCTIRARRKRPVRPGDRASLREWTGKPYRSKQRLLREGTVTKVTPFLISYSYVALDGKELSFAATEKLAIADGFDNGRDLINYFFCDRGLPFEADLIEWSVV